MNPGKYFDDFDEMLINSVPKKINFYYKSSD